MSMHSYSHTDFIEQSLGRCGRWVSTAAVTCQGASRVDVSVRDGDFSWPKSRDDFSSPPAGRQLAMTGEFLMAHGTDEGRIVPPALIVLNL